MNDEQLSATWTTLEPSGPQLRRIDVQVSAWLDAHDTTIAEEWLALFRVSPFAGFGLAAVSAVSVILATPVLWVARALV
jgi:hypothetical protein